MAGHGTDGAIRIFRLLVQDLTDLVDFAVDSIELVGAVLKGSDGVLYSGEFPLNYRL